MRAPYPALARAGYFAIAALILHPVWAFHSFAQEIPAQAIVFDRYDFNAAKPVQQLALINPDGTGERQIIVNLPEFGYPIWSRDGLALALTSVDPETPFAYSRNVYIFDLVTAQVTQITHFSDGPVGGGSHLTFPWYKAFSRTERELPSRS